MQSDRSPWRTRLEAGLAAGFSESGQWRNVTLFQQAANQAGAPEVDCYVLSDRDVMRSYCQAVGHRWPYADETAESVWLYGVTFNNDTQQIDVVKAYERTQATA